MYSDKKFWELHEAYQFTVTEIALYFYLMEVRNKCLWADSIKRNNAKITVDLSISFHTLQNARNKLKQAGAFDFKTQNGSPNVIYTFANFAKVSNEVSNEVGNEVGNELIKNKKKEIDKSISKKNNFEKLKADFKNQIAPHVPKFGKDMCNAFFAYWTEKSKSGKMRFEGQKFFEVEKRLNTWRENNFNKKSFEKEDAKPTKTIPYVQ